MSAPNTPSAKPERYLLAGREHLLKKEFLADLRKKTFTGASDASLNYQEWDASEESAFSQALGAARTAPFLAEKRICVLWAVEELDDEDREALLAALPALPPATVMVFSSEETPKKNKFLQELESRATLVACHPPFDRDLPGWVEARVRRSNGTIARDAVRSLIEKSGKETPALANAIEQLLVYIHPRTAIAAADVEALLGRSAEEDIFAIADDVLSRDTAAALRRAQRLFEEGARAPEIIGVLAGQFERMKQAADMIERGATPAEAANAMRVHSFFQQKFFGQLRKLSKPGIADAQRRLLECDTMIKQGRLAERPALERFILESGRV